jgi:hypothetical protein
MARPSEADVVLKDEAMMRDLRPLFLPTEFNATLSEPRREPGRTILDDEAPRVGGAEAELSIGRDLPPIARLGSRPADKARGSDVLMAADNAPGLVGIGRTAGKVAAFAGRSGFVEIVAAWTGQTVLAEALPKELGPPGNKAWEPMELFAAVDASGLVAPLVVIEGSRVDEVDAHFRRTLEQRYRVGERLPPGFYRIVIGP